MDPDKQQVVKLQKSTRQVRPQGFINPRLSASICGSLNFHSRILMLSRRVPASRFLHGISLSL